MRSVVQCNNVKVKFKFYILDLLYRDYHAQEERLLLGTGMSTPILHLLCTSRHTRLSSIPHLAVLTRLHWCDRLITLTYLAWLCASLRSSWSLASAICQMLSTVNSASSPQHFWYPCIFCRQTNSLEFTAWSLRDPAVDFEHFRRDLEDVSVRWTFEALAH